MVSKQAVFGENQYEKLGIYGIYGHIYMKSFMRQEHQAQFIIFEKHRF